MELCLLMFVLDYDKKVFCRHDKSKFCVHHSDMHIYIHTIECGPIENFEWLISLKVPDEKVKEISEYSREMLQNVEKARTEANYNEVCQIYTECTKILFSTFTNFSLKKNLFLIE